jgi:phage host-nuclease inhibitor protein Gam
MGKKKTVPTNLEDTNAFIAQIGEIMRKMDAFAAEADASIAEILEAMEGCLIPLRDEVKRLFAGVHSFGKENRSSLTVDGKTVKLLAGEFGWRLSPHKVGVKRGAEGDILAELHRRGLARILIRVKEAIDREAVKKNLPLIEGIDGLSVVQDERFFVKPLSHASELEANAKTGRLSMKTRAKRVKNA